MNPLNMDMPVQVPVDDPNADTEWNDILRSKGIIPPKAEDPTPQIEAALVEARRLAHEHRLEGKDLDELDALEDDEDDAFLATYRAKRFGELADIATRSVYGHVYPVQKPEYARQVTDESHKAWVLVLLVSSAGENTESALASGMWTALAVKYGDVKFCQMRAGLCIEGYPDRNTPTVLVYREGDIKKQLVTLRELGGARANIEDFEEMLVQLGAVKRGDARMKRDKEEVVEEKRGIRSSDRPARDDDEDSDWD